MSLKEQDRQVIVIMQLEKADKVLSELDFAVQGQRWSIAANRLYYALFHSVKALLISDRHEVGTHRGAVGLFSLHYVKTGIFTKEEGHLYGRLQTLRENGDYNCFIEVTREDIEPFIEPTRQLIDKIKDYIKQKQTSNG